MTTVGVRDLKAHLSAYLAKVKAGETVVITEHGKTIGRIEPNAEVAAAGDPTLTRLVRDGVVEWSGRRFRPPHDRLTLDGSKPVSDIVIEDRGPR